jgi:hypothetical protein
MRAMRKTGTSTGGVEASPRWRKKRERARKAEEARWKSLSGPVTSYVDPSAVRPKAEHSGHDDRAVGATAE